MASKRLLTDSYCATTESCHAAGGQGVAGSNPVVPTCETAGRRPFPPMAGAAFGGFGVGAGWERTGSPPAPTRRRVNPVRFVRHPIGSIFPAVSRRTAPSSTARPGGHPHGKDAACIKRLKRPLTVSTAGSTPRSLPGSPHPGPRPIATPSAPPGLCPAQRPHSPHLSGRRTRPLPPQGRAKPLDGAPQTGHSPTGSAVPSRCTPPTPRSPTLATARAGGVRTSPSGLRTSSPWRCTASRCWPRATKVTSAPAAARRAPKYPPTPPAPRTAIRTGCSPFGGRMS